VPGYTIGDGLKSDRSVQSVYKTGELEVFRLDSGGHLFRPAARTVTINSYYDELAIAQKLTPPQLEQISFADRQSRIGTGFGALDVNDYRDFYDINSGFEEKGADGRPVKWDFASNVNPFMPDTQQGQAKPPNWTAPLGNKEVSISLDTGTRTGGRQSIKIVNPATKDLSVYSVPGSETAVAEGEIYNIETSIKYDNAQWTHAAVEGFDPRSSKWVTLVNCPVIQSGTSSWKKTEYSFYMPPGISKIRPVLVAGWSKSAERPATSWFDDIKLSKLNNRFYSNLLGGTAPANVSFKQLSPEKYEVQVRGATAPFILVFGEAYDPLWVARVNGKNIDPVRLYSTISGFPVNRKGDFRLTVEYIPQNWFMRGLVVSLVFLFGCFLFLALALLVKKRTLGRKRMRAGEDTG
jgi:hypothetical protein